MKTSKKFAFFLGLFLLWNPGYEAYAGSNSSKPRELNIERFCNKKPEPVKVPLTFSDKGQAALTGVLTGVALVPVFPSPVLLPLVISGAAAGARASLLKTEQDYNEKVNAKSLKAEQGKMSMVALDDALFDMGIDSKGRRKVRQQTCYRMRVPNARQK